jgi:phage-related protein
VRVRRLLQGQSFTVYAACDTRGECDLIEFLDSLGANLQGDGDHMLSLLERVSINGPPRNTEICHQIQNDLWEFIKGRLRVLWFYDKGRIVVCTHGFVKSSPKTPKAEIAKATTVRAQYFAAKARNDLEIEEDDNG